MFLRSILPILVLAGSLAGQGVPELPKLTLQSFAPPIREQFEEAYAVAKAKPQDADASAQLGMLLHAYGEYESAAACYKRATFQETDEFRWKYYLGVVEAELGRHAAAVAILRKALKIRPDYVSAALQVAESLLASGAIGESGDVYQNLLSRLPDSPQVHYGLGRVKAALDDGAAAIEHYERACSLFENFGASHYALALAYRNLGDSAKAQKHFLLYEKNKLTWPPLNDPLLDAVKRLDKGPIAYLQRGAEFEAAGQLDQAIAEHERALEVYPRFEQAHVNLITLYGKLGQVEKAEKHYRAAVSLNPKLADSHYNFGLLMTAMSKYQEAAEAFRKALEVNPLYAEAHNNLGYLLEQSGQLDQAIQHFQSAIENKPNYRLAYFHLGRLLLRRGETSNAIEHFLKTLSPEDDSTPGFMYALAAAFARAKDRERALHYGKEARKRASSLGQTQLLELIERGIKILEEENRVP